MINEISPTNASIDNAIDSVSFDKTLGARIRHYRVLRGITQATLGKMLKISPQQIQKYESGRNRLSVERLVQLACKLGIDCSVLLKHEPAGAEETLTAQTIHQPLTLELFRAFSHLRSHDRRTCVLEVARLLGE